MKKRTVDYLQRQNAFKEMAHPLDVKSLLIAEFNASRNIVVKKDILKTIEEIDHMGRKAPEGLIAGPMAETVS
ncbi:MAG: hypothetical protein ABIX01_17310 [Chitinophagaceae bacterium]